MEKVKYYPYLDTLKVSKILKDYCLVYEIDFTFARYQIWLSLVCNK